MAHAAAKIAISLPVELFRLLERARKVFGKSRSEIVQDALRRWAAHAQLDPKVRQYIEGYRKHPDTAEEIAAAGASAVALLAKEPWA